MYAVIAIIFVFGYLMIAFEHNLKVDKAASALLTAVLLWTLLALGPDPSASWALGHHLAEIAGILFFLFGAMAIVELMDAHEGFRMVTDHIRTRNKVALLWVLGFVTFFLSSVLDNLTSAIVMVTLLRKLVRDTGERWLYAGVVVIAANAGGAWSPIGDVTTTMLWMGNQVTTAAIMKQLFLPSLVCLLIPLVLLSFRLEGNMAPRTPDPEATHRDPISTFERNLVFVLGITALLFVPVFKTVTGLPPYMGILSGLGMLWVVTEIVHGGKKMEQRYFLSIAGALKRVDTATIFFFLGILLAVSALGTAGILQQVGEFLSTHLGNVYGINLAIGLLSAVVDNVPLVAGAMKMYPLVTPEQLASAGEQEATWLGHFVVDGTFWEFLAYCAGTGGSCLIIGSAAGVAIMGIEKMDFFWYLKNISLLALLGYLGGALVYIGIALL